MPTAQPMKICEIVTKPNQWMDGPNPCAALTYCDCLVLSLPLFVGLDV